MKNGYTLLELLLVMMIIGILGSFAAVSYASYTVRTQVSAGIPQATSVFRAIEEVYVARGQLPNNNAEAGLTAPESFETDYIKSITVSAGGNVSIVYGNKTSENIHDSKLAFYVALTANNNIVWVCGEASPEEGAVINNRDALIHDLSSRYLPPACQA